MTVQERLERWVEWLHRLDGCGGPGPLGASMQRFKFLEGSIGEQRKPLTARGKQTRSYRSNPAQPDNPQAQATEAAILQMRQHRPDLFLVVVAEYLGMYPSVHPEAWRTAWRNTAKRRWLLDVIRQPHGVSYHYGARREAESQPEYRARIGRQIGLKTRAYEARLSEAHTYLGCYFDLADHGRLVA